MRPRKHMSIAEIIGRNIKRHRLIKGLKVKDLAKAMNIAVQSWYKWERGDVIPEDMNQLRIAATLGVGVDDIRMGIGTPPDFVDADEGKGVRSLPPSPSRKEKSRVPVIGLASSDISGWYNPMPLAVRAPPPVDYDTPDSLFAVLAMGEGMEPDGIRAGYLLYCDATKNPEPGDAVYVRTRDGNAAIKRFLKRDGDWLLFQGWLDPDRCGNQEPHISKYAKEYVANLACVVVVRRKA